MMIQARFVTAAMEHWKVILSVLREGRFGSLLMKKVWALPCCTDRELRNILSISGVVMMNRSFTQGLEAEPAVSHFGLLKH